MTEVPVQSWTLVQPTAAEWPPAPAPDATWAFPGAGGGGTGWVYYSNPDHRQIVKPIILADGFSDNPKSSNIDELWEGMEGHGQAGKFRFITALRDRGYDPIILGYDDRTASILVNAEVAIACIHKAISERAGDAPLVVGGFSMGGLVTRYALAKMEHESMDHQTSVYFSYDSPHRGAWIPISLQALAHFLTIAPAMSRTINSPAARQLLWRHIETVDDEPVEDPMRIEFLNKLRQVGWWPNRPRKLGVANGTSTGVGNGVPAKKEDGEKQEALKVTGALHPFKGTTLYIQAAGDNQLVAQLKGPQSSKSVSTSGIPELDGAPGGTLESFGLARDNLANFGATEATYRSICFVPSVSAVAIEDIDTQEKVYTDINSLPPENSELDEFRCATDNEAHTLMTEELGMWIIDHIK